MSIMDKLKDLKEQAEDLAEKVSDKAEDLAEKVTDKVDDIDMATVKAKAGELAEKVSDAVNDINVSEIKEKAGEAAAKVGALAGSAVGAVKERIGGKDEEPTTQVAVEETPKLAAAAESAEKASTPSA